MVDNSNDKTSHTTLIMKSSPYERRLSNPKKRKPIFSNGSLY
jgi:hypothetical protein